VTRNSVNYLKLEKIYLPANMVSSASPSNITKDHPTHWIREKNLITKNRSGIDWSKCVQSLCYCDISQLWSSI